MKVPLALMNALCLSSLSALCLGAAQTPSGTRTASASGSGGELRVVGDAEPVEHFPLEHTDVRVEITGNLARVEVRQHFANPYERKIEAVYVFPLASRAAVHDMKIEVGERTIRAVIKERDEARRVYEAAQQRGHVAALLDQERPNVFTQSVANILPGNDVIVEIRYFEVVPVESSAYEFSFPMVVGPRFIPGTPTASGERGWSPNTTDVPDASRITPPVLPPGRRSSHDISLEARVDVGTELAEISSPSHRVEVVREGHDRARVRIESGDSIPNKDFVLRYRLGAEAPRVAFLPHRTDDDGYFLMLIQPESEPESEEILPKEMVFVVDGSGSMSGFPIEKVKEAMRHALRHLNPNDTFRIIRFSNGVETFRPTAVAATGSHIRQAIAYVEGLSGRGGTIMLEGVRAALDAPEDPERLRIVAFMTDGYIGNEQQILRYLEKNLGETRLFSFGVGSSVNRHLLDEMASFGRGAVEYVLLGDDTQAPVRRFYERVKNPYLTDIEIDWGELEITDVYPRRAPDLFAGQPVVLHGRYGRPGQGTVTLRGRLGVRPYEQRVRVVLPERHRERAAIKAIWARARIEELSREEIVAPRPELVEEITRVALAHRLVSSYTSFVAVEERITTGSDEPRRVEVPVGMPGGVSYEGVFGVPGGVAGGVPGGVVGGIVGGLPGAPPPPRSALTSPLHSGPVPLRVGGSIHPPRKRNDVAPAYPDIAKQARVEGRVILEAVVDAEGNVASVRVLRSVPLLDRAAIDAVKQWRYAPTVLNGTAVPVVMTITVNFALSPDTEGVRCRLGSERPTYRRGEPIELSISFENGSRAAIRVPQALSVVDGTARFQIVDTRWRELPHPSADPEEPETRMLAPGERVELGLTLNGEGGYRLDRPGTFHIVYLGSEIGLPDSNSFTLRILSPD